MKLFWWPRTHGAENTAILTAVGRGTTTRPDRPNLALSRSTPVRVDQVTNANVLPKHAGLCGDASLAELSCEQ
jgi:hypothetical protein